MISKKCAVQLGGLVTGNQLFAESRRKVRGLIAGSIALLSAMCIVSPLKARADWFRCDAIESLAFTGNRVHIKCSNTVTLSGNVVQYIAIPYNSAFADFFLRSGTSSMTNGLKFFADLPVSPATNVAGCNSVDCRTPVNFGLAR